MKRAIQLLSVSILLVGQVLGDGANPFRTGGQESKQPGGTKGLPQPQSPNGIFGAPAASGTKSVPGRKGNKGGGRGGGRRGAGFPFGKKQNQGCGGKRQACCANSQCQPGLECLNRGDDNWVGLEKRCSKRKFRGNCGTEGLRCCGRKCVNGLVCAGNKMCRKPLDSVVVDPNAVGQSVATLSGWVLVRVRARGGKCFVKVTGDVQTSSMTYGEGTFSEVFGSLSGLGECEEDAQGRGIGYIRLDVLATAVLNADGECVADSETQAELFAKVKGDGISVSLDGGGGANVGCYRKRKLLISDFF